MSVERLLARSSPIERNPVLGAGFPKPEILEPKPVLRQNTQVSTERTLAPIAKTVDLAENPDRRKQISKFGSKDSKEKLAAYRRKSQHGCRCYDKEKGRPCVSRQCPKKAIRSKFKASDREVGKAAKTSRMPERGSNRINGSSRLAVAESSAKKK